MRAALQVMHLDRVFQIFGDANEAKASFQLIN